MKVAPPLCSENLRAFFHGIFAESIERRRLILRHWHSPYPTSRKQHTRLADCFAEFIELLLFQPVSFRVRIDHFCLVGAGADHLRVPYAWLTANELDFIVNQVFAHRHALFGSVKKFENNMFQLDQFKGGVGGSRDGGTLSSPSTASYWDPMWARELTRDFVWLVVSRKDNFMLHELAVALQRLMLAHPLSLSSLMLRALHDGVQGLTNVALVPCWGLEHFDFHTDERENKKT
jgi:hypothetical protein